MKALTVDRLVVAIAALVCLFFVARLYDTRLAPLGPIVNAPPVPKEVGERDANLHVHVISDEAKSIDGATVRVFVIRDGKAYFAGDHATDAKGDARFVSLPRGETWVLAYGKALARASSKLVLEKGDRDLELVLAKANALDVVVVGDEDQPIAGANVEVTANDPLPYGATTDDKGAARFDRLGAAPYSVHASAKGYDDMIKTNVAPSNAPLRIKLEHLAAIDALVVDASGAPVEGATVLTAGTGLWPPRSATTDASGKVRIAGLHGGVYDLKARTNDRVSKTELAVPVKRGESKAVKLVLVAGHRVTITVTDGDAEKAPAIPNASVALVEEGISSFPLYGKTNKEGVVVLGPIASVGAVVAARAQGFVSKTVNVDQKTEAVQVPLDRGAVIVGEVWDDRGFPVGAATLEVIGVDPQGAPIDESSTMGDFRDAEFAFALPGPRPLIPAGELGVMPGPIPDLPHEGSVDASASSPSRSGDPWVTKVDGTFRCEPVTPGRVHVLVRHPSYVETLSDVIALKPGDEAHVKIIIHEGGSIEGRVLEAEGRLPVGGARVELAATKGTLERVTYAADDGTFTFTAVPDEVVLTVARPETPTDVVARAVVAVADRDRTHVEILLPKVRDTIKIRVVDDRGFAVDKVEVRAVSLDASVPLRRTIFTDDDGDGELPDAVGLALRFTLVRPSKAPLVEQVESAPNEMRFVLAGGLRAFGVVTSRNGHDKIDGAEITVFTSAGARHTKSDDEGGFSFDDLAPGRVRITARKDGLAPNETIVKLAGDKDHPFDLGRIDLPEAGEVEGRVVDDHGDGVSGARVSANGAPTYLPLGPLPPGVVLTDRDGRFLLGGLPEGSAVIEAYHAELGRASSDEVSVRAGRTARKVTITLPGGAAAKKEPKGAGSVAVTLGERDHHVLALMVPPGSEAEVAGLEPEDRILAVDGEDVHTIEGARKRLTGPLTEDVVIKLRRDEDDGPKTWLARVRRERVRR